ncbi:MAG: disulfide bond formation protein B [Nanoarchaeota archaeon]|nr:disulfide bond formation protein B [Nanoarchaeota archaeon]
MTNYFSEILILLTLIGDFIIILFIILYVYQMIKGKRLFNNIKLFLENNYIIISFIISLAATLGSLYYSEILHYNPCKLCWYQRIFMYPQTIIFGTAYIIKDKKIAIYGMILSIIGAFIAGFHYMLQLSNSPSFSCDAIGYSASCTEKFFLSYYYITIPIMAVTAFGLLIILGLYGKNKISPSIQ